jgi:alpha-L-fucosidase
MLNIGPRANGDVPFEISQRMLEMGKWLEINGESIYGAEAFDLEKDLHDWGKITCKKTGNGFNLYLHVFNWPLNKELGLTGISSIPKNIYSLSDKQKSPLKFLQNGSFTRIDLPDLQTDPYISVIVVEYDKKPGFTNGLVAKTTEGGYSLTPKNINPPDETLNIKRKERSGTLPEYGNIDSHKILKWKLYIDSAGEKNVDISYSFQNNSAKNQLMVKTANTTLSHIIKSTGKTVGEPNQNWVINNFKSQSIGKINFPEIGFYEIELEVIPAENGDMEFQWIWIR